MGTDPLPITEARLFVRKGIALPVGVGKGLLDYIDTLERKLELIEEDKD